MTNKYSEGRPNARYYGGNEFIDKAELQCEVCGGVFNAHAAIEQRVRCLSTAFQVPKEVLVEECMCVQRKLQQRLQFLRQF
jgi:glycine/serine hydroxymethyltransferase